MKPTARNSDYLKEYNRKLVLQMLRREPLSRAELARRSGLTRAAVTLIADELLDEKMIVELPSVHKAKGRSPVPLMLCDDSLYAIGVYLSRGGCVLGLCNINGQVLRSVELDNALLDRPAAALEEIAKQINDMKEALHIPAQKLLGIGMSCPGPLDKRRGYLIDPSGFSAWHKVEIAEILSKKTGLPVRLENNAYSLALYEKAYGVAKDLHDYMLLLVDTGVGGGIIKQDRLFENARGFSGEIGHTSIMYRGLPCPCGRCGCLEAYASIPALLARHGMQYGQWHTVGELARRKDANALDILAEETAYLSAAIQNVTNLLGIEAILLDGDLSPVFDLIAPALEQAINANGPAKHFVKISVHQATGGEQTKIVAAANILYELYLQ